MALAFLQDGGFWFSLAQIIAIDILLGGDNAVVIALACRRLPEAQRKLGIFWGVVGAIALRIALIFFAVRLLELPFLKLAGAALLVWIGVKLLIPEAEEGHDTIEGSTNLLGAIRTVVVADAVMSIDNVIAVAGAAHGDMTLVVFGILVSIPIIVAGSRVVLHLMDRFSWVITFGGGLLGWIAGGMAVGDPALVGWVASPQAWHYPAAACGAVVVVTLGTWMARRVAGRAAVTVEISLDPGPDRS
ncbi:MAG: TerC family protein [Zoogloeaceae bacterium]|nr:TerC family protein [Zoogloeaceae bacterium]